MLFDPHKDNIFVVVDKRENELESGLVLPQGVFGVGDNLLIGRVFKVGPGGIDDDGRLWSTDISPGDQVLFKRLAGEVVVVGDDIAPSSSTLPSGTEFRVLRFNEIEGVLQ